jgi:Chaperone of endosialidase
MKKIQNWFRIMTLTVISSTLTITAYSQNIPDNDLKTNVSEVSNALEKLKKLEPITFEYNTDKYKQLNLEKGKQYGFMADKFRSVFPEMVYNRHIPYTYAKNQNRDMVIQKMDTESLIPILVASIKELEAEIAKLKMELSNNNSNNSSKASKQP